MNKKNLISGIVYAVSAVILTTSSAFIAKQYAKSLAKDQKNGLSPRSETQELANQIVTGTYIGTTLGVGITCVERAISSFRHLKC